MSSERVIHRVAMPRLEHAANATGPREQRGHLSLSSPLYPNRTYHFLKISNDAKRPVSIPCFSFS